MTPREGADGWVAPVTQLFGAPARSTSGSPVRAAPSKSSADDEGWYVPTEDDAHEIQPDDTPATPIARTAAISTDESPVEPRRLPTLADFDRDSHKERSVRTPVVEATDRFARRRALDRGATSDQTSDPADEERESPRRRIENVSTAALARRGLSVSEVRTRLMDKGFTSDQVEPEIQRLVDARYLDDRRLAEEIVRIETERKGKGRSAIVAELRRRGIDADDFDDVMAELDSDDELDRARDFVLKKLSSLRNVEDETAKRRLYGALARRGFGGDVVRTAVAEGMVDRP